MTKKATTSANRINLLKDGITRADKHGINGDKGTAELILYADDKPSSKGVSHDSKGTFMIGQGSGPLSDTSEPQGKSAPTLESSIPSTMLTSLRPWTPWTFLIPPSHRLLTQPTQWLSNVGSTSIKSI